MSTSMPDEPPAEPLLESAAIPEPKPEPAPESVRGFTAYDLLFPDKRSDAEKRVEALAAEVDRLREELLMEQNGNKWLQGDNEALQAQARWYDQLWSNPGLDSGVKLTAYHVWRVMYRRLVYRRLDGSIPIDIGQLAAASGQGRNTVTRHLDALVAIGAITRTVELVSGKGSKRKQQGESAQGSGKGKKSVSAPVLAPAPELSNAPGTRVSLSPGLLFYDPARWQIAKVSKSTENSDPTLAVSAQSDDAQAGIEVAAN